MIQAMTVTTDSDCSYAVGVNGRKHFVCK